MAYGLLSIKMWTNLHFLTVGFCKDRLKDFPNWGVGQEGGKSLGGGQSLGGTQTSSR